MHFTTEFVQRAALFKNESRLDSMSEHILLLCILIHSSNRLIFNLVNSTPVSYTHLTLPTIYSV